MDKNVIYVGDVLKSLLVIGENSIDIVIPSPPYNVNISYDNHNDAMPYDEYLEWQRKVWEAIFSKIKVGGRVCLNIAPTGVSKFIPVHMDLVSLLCEIGFILRAEILWYKQNIRTRTAWGSFKSPSNPHVLPSWEYVYIFHKEVPKMQIDKTLIDICFSTANALMHGIFVKLTILALG